jgi:HK97 family phage major capsid protein
MNTTSRNLAGGSMLLALIATIAGVIAGIDIVSALLGIDWRDAAHSGLTLMEGAAAITIGEQIKSFKAKRLEILGKLKDLVDLSVKEGRSLDATERENHVGWKAELAVADEHIKMLEEHEQLLLAEGKGIDTTAGREEEGQRETRGAKGANDGVLLPGGGRQMTVKPNLPPGLRFTRFALAMAHAKGNVMLAHEIAKQRFADTPEVINCLKAAISMGGTKDFTLHTKAAVTPVAGTDTAVTQYNDLENEFVDLLRPKMIIGRMTQLNRVPFLSRVGRQLTGVTGSFVGEGAPKPVQKQTYDNVTLGYAKVAVIVVLSEEAVRFSSIQAQVRARDDMVKGVATYIDKRFMDPSYSGTANVAPASITNAARRIQASGSTLAAIDADARNAFAEFATSDVDPSTAVWVMGGAVALRLATKRNAYDELAFPGMEAAIATGRGVWYGLPVLVSNSMVSSGSPSENQIALVTQEEVFMAEDTGISIDMSTEASVQMNDAPSAGAQSLVSLWQNNLLGLRAEQFINWAPRRTSNLGIVLIENTNY